MVAGVSGAVDEVASVEPGRVSSLGFSVAGSVWGLGAGASGAVDEVASVEPGRVSSLGFSVAGSVLDLAVVLAAEFWRAMSCLL
ncbi:hypothetical protein [Pseudomonas phage ZCPA1]|nr:hypothetical protein [Pseudomonas phage ZCPA1]